MAITRTPIVDDDGSGQTGTVIDNAWKQELYNQIDAVIGGVAQPCQGSWTPIDTSGAGLVFASPIGRYSRNGNLITVFLQMAMPATANAAAVSIGGLPFANGGGVPGGGYTTYGPQFAWHVGQGASAITVFHSVSSAQQTNANLSGLFFTLVLSYLAG